MKTTNLNIRQFPAELKRQMKAKAAQEGLTLTAFVIKWAKISLRNRIVVTDINRQGAVTSVSLKVEDAREIAIGKKVK